MMLSRSSTSATATATRHLIVVRAAAAAARLSNACSTAEGAISSSQGIPQHVGVRTFATARGATASSRTTVFPDLSDRVVSVLPTSFGPKKQLFSTAAQAQVEHVIEPPAAAAKKPKKRMAIKDKNPIILTDLAADRIKELLAGESAVQAHAVGLRIGVKRRGCNGLSYTLNYATPEQVAAGKDILMESHGLQVFIDPMALFNVVGTVMDWEESEMASEFTFQNPNSKGECGCGESFNV